VCVPSIPACRGVLGFELGGFLPVARSLNGLVVDLWPDGELARRVFRPGVRRADRTGATGRRIVMDAHDGIPGDIPAWSPFDACLSLGTARPLCLSIDHKRL
jgi:hypothetical protein